MLFNITLAFLIAFIFTYALVPYSIKVAHKIGAIDVPKDKRKIHKKPMPRFGGMAVILGFLVGAIFFLITSIASGGIDLFGPDQYGIKLLGFLIAIIVLAIFDTQDDRKGIKPLVKLFSQILAATIVILAGVRIDIIDFRFVENVVLSDALQILFTMGWIVGITNAINLIDGLDGLSSGITLISSLSLLTIFCLNNSPLIAIVLITALAGSLAGFLPFNFHPAKTFIGDIGSNFLGFSIAVISILGVAKTATTIVVILPILILGIPIFDTITAIFRRIIKGHSIKAIFQADRGHLHHRLMDMGLSQTQAVVLLYSITLACGVFSIILFLYGKWRALTFAALIVIIYIMMYINFKKNRKFEKNEEK